MTYTQTKHGTITWTRKLDEGPWIMVLTDHSGDCNASLEVPAEVSTMPRFEMEKTLLPDLVTALQGAQQRRLELPTMLFQIMHPYHG